MITDEHIKEGLSLSYVTAVAQMAGMNMSSHLRDYGVDGTFHNVIERIGIKTRRTNGGINIDFQLKSTVNKNIIKGGIISYALDVDNYNDLVDPEIYTPRILIVYFLPKDRDQWLVTNDDQTILKESAWWCCLQKQGYGMSKNKGKKSIHIPLSQKFDVKTLINLINKQKAGTFYDDLAKISVSDH